MSADLLAAFGTQATTASPAIKDDRQVSGKSEQSSQPRLTKPAVTKAPHLLTPQASLWEQDESGTDILFDASADYVAPEDDFGDFEGPEASSQPGQLTTANTGNIDLLGLDDPNGTIEKVAIQAQVRSMDVHASNSVNVGRIIHFDDNAATTKPPTTKRWETELEDDWGTFQDVELDTNYSRTTSKATNTVFQHSEGLPVDTEEDDWEAFEDEAVTKNAPAISNTNPTLSDPPPEDAEEDEWDAFEDGPILGSQTIPQPATQSQTSKAQPKTVTNTIKLHERPTNIPPPSILLEILPIVYQNLAAQSRSQPSISSTTGTNNNTTTSLASQILRTYHTTARILSGRSLRWKRDPHLSASTRISQSGSTGMKLQFLDRSYVIKEDQDALEAIAAWSRCAHAFNSTIVKAKMRKPSTPLSEHMVVRTASGMGVLTAKEVCAVCGLKRNERIVGVDVGVEDVFGEFWVEFWGHRDCCDFWTEVEGLLDRR